MFYYEITPINMDKYQQLLGRITDNEMSHIATDVVAWSVGLSVCQSICHDREPCMNEILHTLRLPSKFSLEKGTSCCGVAKLTLHS